MSKINNLKKKFINDGFVKIPKLFSKNEITDILEDIDVIKKKFLKFKNSFIHLTKDGKVNTIHNINKFVHTGYINKLSKKKKIVNIAETFLGDKTNLRSIEFFLKPKHTGLKSPYHQDNFYWNFKKQAALNFWIACSESHKKNGGLFYLKKSHINGLINHKISYHPGSSQKIPSKVLKKLKYKKVYPNLKIGDCLVHHCEIIHGSNKNNSNKDRVGLVISYKRRNALIDSIGWKKYKKNLKKNNIYLNKKN